MDESRVSLLEADGLAQRVSAAQQTIRELKQQQFIGSDSIRFYQKDSGAAYDWAGQLPTSPQAAYVGTKILRITATAVNQNVLFADIIAELRVNSNANPRHTVIDYVNEIYAGADSFSIDHYDDPQEPDETNKVSWTVVVSASDWDGIAKPTNTCYVKVYVVANDDVTIAVAELN